MADKLRTLMVGCGAISQAWLEAIKGNDGIEIVGLVDIDEAAAIRRKEQYSLSATTGTDFVAAMGSLRPEIVFDLTVPSAHTAVTLAALERGCHVLGEKPMAETIEDARRMVAAARKADRLYAVIQNRRYQPEIRAFRAALDSGRVGKLTTLNSDFYIGAHFGGFRDHMSHVLLVDMAIHTFDMARLISGSDPVAVYCKEWNPSGSWYDRDASAIAVFEMTGGVVYTYRGSWCAEGLNTSWEADWRAVCDKGSITWDGGDAFRAQAVAETGGFMSKFEDFEVTIPENAKQGGHKGVIDEFVRCARSGETPETVCTDNIKSLAMVFAAVESAETGKRVEIEL